MTISAKDEARARRIEGIARLIDADAWSKAVWHINPGRSEKQRRALDTAERIDRIMEAYASEREREAIERAAKVAQSEADEADRIVKRSDSGAAQVSFMGEAIAARRIATAIRRLSQEGGE